MNERSSSLSGRRAAPQARAHGRAGRCSAASLTQSVSRETPSRVTCEIQGAGEYSAAHCQGRGAASDEHHWPRQSP